MRVSTRHLLIHDIDAAGIAFTGRLVTIALEALESGLSQVGMDFAAMIRAKRYGVPLVHIEGDFKKPMRHGDVVALELVCEEIGARSYTCRVDLMPEGTAAPAASLRFKAAVIDMHTFKAVDMPAEFRTALEKLSP